MLADLLLHDSRLVALVLVRIHGVIGAVGAGGRGTTRSHPPAYRSHNRSHIAANRLRGIGLVPSDGRFGLPGHNFPPSHIMPITDEKELKKLKVRRIIGIYSSSS